MLIPMLRNHFKDGYVPVPKNGAPPVFFPNCNLAIRRKAFESMGMYDESLKATEDVDICRRAALSGWELFFEPQAKCVHGARKNIRALIIQWLRYGYWSAFALKKYRQKSSEIFVCFHSRPRINRYIRFLGTDKLPFSVLLFISYFPMMCLLAISILLSLCMGFGHATLFLFTLFIFLSGVLYLSNPLVRWAAFRRFFDYVFITFLINASCMLGSFVGGLRNGMLYMYPGL